MQSQQSITATTKRKVQQTQNYCNFNRKSSTRRANSRARSFSIRNCASGSLSCGCHPASRPPAFTLLKSIIRGVAESTLASRSSCFDSDCSDTRERGSEYGCAGGRGEGCREGGEEYEGSSSNSASRSCDLRYEFSDRRNLTAPRSESIC